MEATLSNLHDLAALSAVRKSTTNNTLPIYEMGLKASDFPSGGPVQNVIDIAGEVARQLPKEKLLPKDPVWGLPSIPGSGGTLSEGNDQDFALLELPDGTQIAVAANIAAQAAAMTAGKIIKHAPLALLSPALYVARTFADITGLDKQITSATGSIIKETAKDTAQGFLSDSVVTALVVAGTAYLAYKVLF